MHLRLQLSASSGSGYVYAGADIGKHAVVLDQFMVRRTTSGLTVKWGQSGVVYGERAGERLGPSVALRDENLAQYRGIHGGVNTLSFYVFEYGSARVQSVTIFPDSGITASQRSPGRLTLKATARGPSALHIGENITISAVVTNTGKLPVRGVAMDVETNPSGGLKLLHHTPAPPRVLAAKMQWSEQFVLRALRKGEYRLVAVASSSANDPAGLVVVRIGGDDQSNSALWYALIAIVGGAGLLFIGKRLRKAGARG